MNFTQQLASEVRGAIKGHGFSVADISRATPIHYETLRRKLTGQGKAFDMEELHQIAGALGVRLVDLLPDEPEREAA